MLCEKSAACPIFNEKLPMEEGIGAMYVRKYCNDNNENCARYMVATKLGKEFVPTSMLPNQTAMAQEILANNPDK